MLTIIEIGHNSSTLRYQAADRQVTMARYQELLKDPGQTDSPLLTKLGYPVVIVSTTPGRKCIPEVRCVLKVHAVGLASIINGISSRDVSSISSGRNSAGAKSRRATCSLIHTNVVSTHMSDNRTGI